MNAEFQTIARRDKKAFLSDQCKEVEENNRMEKTSLFKGTFHASSVQFSSVAQSCPTLYAPMNRKMGTLKDRNGMDLTEAEGIKKWQEYTLRIIQKRSS